jgi:L-alanine-DL-glutamate epimerase-like enolase superfamily enzyme
MKITDLKAVALKGHNQHIVRVETDEGVYGYGEANWGAEGPLPKDCILILRRFIVGEDPTNVERVMMKMRHMGGNARLGTAVSAVEVALWDIAGKAAGVPIYKLLGGKVRDKVRVYCDCGTGVPSDPENPASRYAPEAYVEKARRKKGQPEGYTVLKFDIGLHEGPLWHAAPGLVYGTNRTYPYKGHVTERGLKYQVACVEAIKEVLGDGIGLALDSGPGQSLPNAIQLAKALEPLNVLWLEDVLTGADNEYVDVDAYRALSSSTSTPIQTGENIYMRQGFKALIDQHAVDIVAPDIMIVGGLAEAKWVAEFADLYSLLVAPHNAHDAIAFIANLHVCATMPRNYIALEFHLSDRPGWDDILTGIDKPLIKDGFATVPDAPGLGIELNEEALRQRLAERETYFE